MFKYWAKAVPKNGFAMREGSEGEVERAYIVRKSSRVDIGLGVHLWIDFLWLAKICRYGSALVHANAWCVRGSGLLLLTLVNTNLVIKSRYGDIDLLNLCWVVLAIIY